MSGKSSAFGKVASVLCCGSARPRERIVATARELFRRHGLRGVGVEAIAEAAGTNKMTLYRHFSSKDDLILECLQKAVEEGAARWQAIRADEADGARGGLHAWVRTAAGWLEADTRGCDLANAAIELTGADHPARRLIERCKTDHRNRLVALCQAARIGQAELLADTLSLLLEGALVSRQSVGAEGPSARFRRMSEAVIDAVGPASRCESEGLRSEGRIDPEPLDAAERADDGQVRR